MKETDNNEIKILIDALKYTSNIIIDLTNKLSSQEEKINLLENKINKIQKITMDNNLKLKAIDFEKSYNDKNKLSKSSKLLVSNTENNSKEIKDYIIEEPNKQEETNVSKNKLSNILEDKNKIHKLIGSIVKRKNDLNNLSNIMEKINDGENKSIECDFQKEIKIEKINNIQEHLKNNIVDEKEQEKIIVAQSNDLDKANNILKQINRRKANFVRKI